MTCQVYLDTLADRMTTIVDPDLPEHTPVTVADPGFGEGEGQEFFSEILPM